jgi:hypothetical protein
MLDHRDALKQVQNKFHQRQLGVLETLLHNFFVSRPPRGAVGPGNVFCLCVCPSPGGCRGPGNVLSCLPAPAQDLKPETRIAQLVVSRPPRGAAGPGNVFLLPCCFRCPCPVSGGDVQSSLVTRQAEHHAPININ